MRDIVVIGTPSGGGAAVAQVVGSLPATFEGSIFIVLHSTPGSPILLADVLNAPGRMRAADALHGEGVERRRIYIAADGHHLLLREQSVQLSENGRVTRHRPSIDALFSSAAETYQARVIGVLLLHAREDGTLGLREIRRHGGRTVTHRNELMPESPLDEESGQPLGDEHLELEKIATRLVALMNEPDASPPPR